MIKMNPAPSLLIPSNYLGSAGFADKVNEQSDAGEGEDNSQGREPFTAG